MTDNTKIIEDLTVIIEKQAQIILDMYEILSQHNAAEAYDSVLAEVQKEKEAAGIERG